jgi:hypothetical protein
VGILLRLWLSLDSPHLGISDFNGVRLMPLLQQGMSEMLFRMKRPFAPIAPAYAGQ